MFAIMLSTQEHENTLQTKYNRAHNLMLYGSNNQHYGL